MAGWIKDGRIFQPTRQYEWNASHAGLPTVDKLNAHRWRIYFAARDDCGWSHTTFVDVKAGDPRHILYERAKPVLPLGGPGAFDRTGIMPGGIVNHAGRKYLFYTGWNVDSNSRYPYHTDIGLAISDDNGETFHKVSEKPIFGPTDTEPYIVGSPCVLVEKGIWRCWYFACTKWQKIEGRWEPFYHIRYAESEDGLHWHRDGTVAIDFRSADEAGIGRAGVVHHARKYHMWFSYRSGYGYRTDRDKSYRIGYAESADGIAWRRVDRNAGIDVSLNGWDSEMIEYPYVLRDDDTWYLFYNGNGFGATGFGYAVARRDDMDEKSSFAYPPSLIGGRNDMLISEDGRELIDMFSAHGTAMLGHADEELSSSLASRAKSLWASGGIDTPILREAKMLIEGFFPPTHAVGVIYSTGMEAAEFAVRVARSIKKSNQVIGFEGSMHGKSLATSYLGWNNRDNLVLPGFYRLPFVGVCPEEEVLGQVRDCIERGSISAVFVEPIQSSSGGHKGSNDFYRKLFRICRDNEVLLVFDEVLTGFYRTGPPFFHSGLGFVPDIVIVGKAMGNGFPVSGVVIDKKYEIEKSMLPGSTFSGNPLASAAIVATLGKMATLDLPQKVIAIEQTIRQTLEPLRNVGVALRGKGALWILEIPAGRDASLIANRICQRGVLLSTTGQLIRLMPAATIESAHLVKACTLVAEEVIKACRETTH